MVARDRRRDFLRPPSLFAAASFPQPTDDRDRTRLFPTALRPSFTGSFTGKGSEGGGGEPEGKGRRRRRLRSMRCGGREAGGAGGGFPIPLPCAVS